MDQRDKDRRRKRDRREDIRWESTDRRSKKDRRKDRRAWDDAIRIDRPDRELDD